MQTIHIQTLIENKELECPFYIGQQVFVIDYTLSTPVIIQGTLLAIGICSPFQTNDLIYLIDREMRQKEEFKLYYEKDIFADFSYSFSISFISVLFSIRPRSICK